MKDMLSTRQVKGIKALIKYPTIKEASEASGIPIRTLENWLAQPEFVSILSQIQYDCLKDAGRGMINSMKKAQESLVDVLDDPTQPGANMKLKAAKTVLEMGTRFYQLIETDERMKRLEEKAGFRETSMIPRLESHYCKKIVEDYRKSNYVNSILLMDQVALDLFDGLVTEAPNKMYLLTDEELVKYDKPYSDKLRLDLLRERQKEIRKTAHRGLEGSPKKKKDKKEIRKYLDLAPMNKKIPSKLDRINSSIREEKLIEESSSTKEGYHPCHLTDEDILKWDPDNFEVIKQAQRENELIRNRGETRN